MELYSHKTSIGFTNLRISNQCQFDIFLLRRRTKLQVEHFVFVLLEYLRIVQCNLLIIQKFGTCKLGESSDGFEGDAQCCQVYCRTFDRIRHWIGLKLTLKNSRHNKNESRVRYEKQSQSVLHNHLPPKKEFQLALTLGRTDWVDIDQSPLHRLAVVRMQLTKVMTQRWTTKMCSIILGEGRLVSGISGWRIKVSEMRWQIWDLRLNKKVISTNDFHVSHSVQRYEYLSYRVRYGCVIIWKTASLI